MAIWPPLMFTRVDFRNKTIYCCFLFRGRSDPVLLICGPILAGCLWSSAEIRCVSCVHCNFQESAFWTMQVPLGSAAS